jgi:FlaA1/EpsC-like NDP-sugar epimerase
MPTACRSGFTGLRAGEKLHEKLYYETETVQATDVEKIIRVVNSPPPADIHERVSKLLQIAFGDRDEELRRLLFESVSVAVEGSPAPVTRAALPVASGRAAATDGRESAAIAQF